jgi:hypothetical protein
LYDGGSSRGIVKEENKAEAFSNNKKPKLKKITQKLFKFKF